MYIYIYIHIDIYINRCPDSHVDAVCHRGAGFQKTRIHRESTHSQFWKDAGEE